MNDLISRSSLLEKRCRIVGYLDQSGYATKMVAIPVDVIERAQAVDAVEVVRCRVCKHWYSGNNESDPLDVCCLHLVGTEPDAFCSCGERKGGDGDG